MVLVSREARQLLDMPAEVASEADRRLLRREVTSARRLAAGAAAVGLGLLGGFAAGFLVAEAGAGRLGGALGALGLALLLLTPASILGWRVTRAGRRVIGGYTARCATGSTTGPEQLVRSVMGPGLVLRSALAAGGAIACCLAGVVLWLAISDTDGVMATIGAVWLLSVLPATWALLAGELRVVWAEGRRTRA